ncbi:hypothetical protein QBC33DRAFT_458707 [Phialemonium atrogriseum]|uniref:Zn(2)-C6 fungal-type domain-containing protein n=1 Tax=Phialemonium atrogriseum TaxID=1093897 RepID=A0AAJ0BVN8_9PEZI|nr:uncharacterized protein QBC33DRAFT_458707 [Phialemonium atrogriseum]KAK1763897.1 hypothetical protein QBC33DRAFT_458707 [Phialemonium atrogriseum]
MADQRDKSRTRIRKTSEICAQCRNRKVRCDGDSRGCGNCKRLRFGCSLVASSSETNESLELLERRRVLRACIPCRDRKLKCSGRFPACSRCLNRGVTCHYPATARSNTSGDPQLSGQAETSDTGVSVPQTQSFARPGKTHSGHSTPGTTHSGHSTPMLEPHSSWQALFLPRELEIDKQTIKQHIDAFFDFVYPIPCYGFFHRATLLQSWSRNDLNPCVLKATCGLASQFIFRGSTKHREVARKWIEATETQLLSRLGEPRMSDIEAWLLVILDHYLSRRFTKMLVSISLVSRLAYILRLNHEDSRQTFLVQERRRRLMWSIYAIDTLYSSGKAEFTACTTETLHIRLPCNEKSFLMDIPTSTGFLNADSDPNYPNIGLVGYCLRILNIRDRVQRLTLTITNHRKPLDECLLAVGFIEHELQRFYTSLPSRYHFDSKAFSLRSFSPSRTPFLMLHAWWHQAHCDLFRFTIPGFREGLPTAEILQMSPDFTTSCQEKCLFHAVSVSRILETPKLVGGSDLISDPSLAMCAFHSARVISRLGQHPMGHMAQVELVARLTACAEALEEQAAIFPTTAILKKGIQDLVSDAQRNRGRAHACPSIWEDEENESIQTTRSVMNHDGESERREIYSKHSVTDIVRNLHFESRDQDEDATRAQTAPILSEESRPMPTVASNSITTGQYVQMDITSNVSEPLNPDSSEFSSHSREVVEYEDNFLTLGFDPRYGSGQPDLFLDSFWPVTDGDWMMPDVNNG